MAKPSAEVEGGHAAHYRDYIIGFLAGVIAKLLTPGDKEPQGFILTTILGIVGAFAATYLGQAIGWYGPNQNAGFIGTWALCSYF